MMWIPLDPQNGWEFDFSTPPLSVSTLEQVLAEATSSLGDGENPEDSNIQLDAGGGWDNDPQTYFDQRHGPFSVSYTPRKAVSEARLRFFDNSNEEWEIDLGSVSLNASASVAHAPVGGAGVHTVVMYFLELDDRKLSITSPTIEDSYYKTNSVSGTINPSDFRTGSPVPPQAGPYAFKHKRAADGSMMVDSSATWRSFEAGNWWAGGTFNAVADNFTDPHYKWKLTGGSLGDKTIEDQVMEADDDTVDLNHTYFYTGDQGFIEYQVWGINLAGQKDGQFMIGHSELEVEVTDAADGSVAKNKMTVAWHPPFEKTGRNADVPDSAVLSTLIEPRTTSFAMPDDPPQTLNISAGIEGIAGALGALDPRAGIASSIAYALAGLVNLEWQYAGNDINNMYVFADEWDKMQVRPRWRDSNHILSPELNDYLDFDNGHVYAKMGLIKVHSWTHKSWTADQYDVHGYVDSGWKLWVNDDNQIQLESTWELDPDAELPPLDSP